MRHTNCLHPDGESCVFCAQGTVTPHDGKCLRCGGESPILVLCEACATQVREKMAIRPVVAGVGPNAAKQTFERTADATIGEARAIYASRGQEYADSWADENLITTFLDATFRALDIEGLSDLAKMTAQEKRLIQLACLIDVKDSRMGGGFKPDSVIDGIAYRASWCAHMREYMASRNS